MKIFVYGTLLKGLPRHINIKNSPCLGPGLAAAGLYDLGSYPGIVKKDGLVVGELYEVTENVLNTLDQIEGCNQGNKRSSLYLREELPVRRFTDGLNVQACGYFFNHPVNAKDLIWHGDYRRYLLEMETVNQWVVAYGSNLSTERLHRRVGKPLNTKKGYIEGYRLVFNKKAEGKASAYANISYIGPTERCPAVAYELSPEQSEILDLNEGTGKHRGRDKHHYLRITIPFTDDSGRTQIMQAYVAHPARLVRKGKPTNDYLAHIRTGYKEHGFDEGYLNRALTDTLV